jgi:hypothetical protein
MALCTPACILSLVFVVLLSQLADPGGSAVYLTVGIAGSNPAQGMAVRLLCR